MQKASNAFPSKHKNLNINATEFQDTPRNKITNKDFQSEDTGDSVPHQRVFNMSSYYTATAAPKDVFGFSTRRSVRNINSSSENFPDREESETMNDLKNEDLTNRLQSVRSTFELLTTAFPSIDRYLFVASNSTDESYLQNNTNTIRTKSDNATDYNNFNVTSWKDLSTKVFHWFCFYVIYLFSKCTSSFISALLQPIRCIVFNSKSQRNLRSQAN